MVEKHSALMTDKVKGNTRKLITQHKINVVRQRAYVHSAEEDFIVLRNHKMQFGAKFYCLEPSKLLYYSLSTIYSVTR